MLLVRRGNVGSPFKPLDPVGPAHSGMTSLPDKAAAPNPRLLVAPAQPNVTPS